MSAPPPKGTDRGDPARVKQYKDYKRSKKPGGYEKMDGQEEFGHAWGHLEMRHLSEGKRNR